jgi:hypothetical protein
MSALWSEPGIFCSIIASLVMKNPNETSSTTVNDFKQRRERQLADISMLTNGGPPEQNCTDNLIDCEIACNVVPSGGLISL